MTTDQVTNPRTGWDFTQDQRDEAIEEAICPFCDALPGDPCVVMEAYKHDSGEPYTHYAHLERVLEVYPL